MLAFVPSPTRQGNEERSPNTYGSSPQCPGKSSISRCAHRRYRGVNYDEIAARMDRATPMGTPQIAMSRVSIPRVNA